MEANDNIDKTSCLSLLITSALLLVAAAYWHRHVIRKRNRARWDGIGKDIVVLHCSTPGYFSPSLSPFVFKLMNYLRLAKIPYKLDHEEIFGPKGKTPWITLNGEDISDSQLVIETLAKKFDKNFSRDLSPEQQAVARAFTIMLDEHLAWGLRYWRYKLDKGRSMQEAMKIPFYMLLMKPFFLRSQQDALWQQGMGRHTPTEVEEVTIKDLAALSHYLGTNPYLMGNSLCEVDCSMFAFVANILCNYKKSPYYSVVKDNYSNLYDYVQRVKAQLWPDWDECLESK
ncbi:hypothetical protein SK128_021676 [Halocaridina rubra]|uniref:Failed axon connections homolog n=1 Tax=Halocaridina rubra TaxID=373956 RepID=A0AAN8XAE2_HALRR